MAFGKVRVVDRSSIGPDGSHSHDRADHVFFPTNSLSKNFPWSDELQFRFSLSRVGGSISAYILYQNYIVRTVFRMMGHAKFIQDFISTSVFARAPPGPVAKS